MFTIADKKTTSTAIHRKESRDPVFFRKAGQDGPTGEQQHSFFSPYVQAKLSVSHPDDPQEKEADAVAEHVMRMPEPVATTIQNKEEERSDRKEETEERKEKGEAIIQPKTEYPTVSIQRKESEEDDKVQMKFYPDTIYRLESDNANMPVSLAENEEPTQVNRKPNTIFRSDMIRFSGRGPPAGSTRFETFLNSSKGQGSPMPESTHQFMESRFNADFSDVRIHTGSDAESMSRQMNAQAFTHGNDIYFNSGKYSPHTDAGGMLLAHELTHTIQQGAVNTNVSSSGAQHSLQRKNIIQRVPSGPVPQLANAVENAKSKEGKVNAGKEGPDGNREGWQDLLEFFKSTFGADKIISGAGGTSVPGTVAEQDIKKSRTATGMMVNKDDVNGDRITGERDAMPSWCGIFVFWALNSGGVPMPKWKLGKSVIKPEAAYPAGYVPRAGDIAYKEGYSHYAIVESATGNTVRSVNGNTAGEDNLGGQIQTREHPVSNWTGFFNPLLLMQGSLGNGQGPEAEKPKTLSELRKEKFHIDKKDEEAAATIEIDREKAEPAKETGNEVTPVQTKTELIAGADGKTNTSSTSSPQLNENKFQAKEEDKKDEEDKLQASHDPPRVQFKADNNPVQRSWLGNAWNAVAGLAGEIGGLIEEGINAAKDWLMDKLVAFVEVIPGYKLARYILGHDPVSGRSVDKTPLNLLTAVIALIPVGGNFILSVLDYFKATQPVADWLFASVGRFVAMIQGIGAQFEAVWNGISLESIRDPERIINQVAELFRNTITSIFNFAVECGSTFLTMVKDIALNNVVEFVQNYFPDAFDMLCIVLGENPITKQKVVRNGTNIMNAGLKMLGEEGAQMKEQMMANGIFQKCVAWIDLAIMVVTTSVAEVKEAFSSLWNTITFESLFHPVDTFNLVVDKFKRPVTRVFNFIKDAVIALLKILRDALLGRLSAYARETKGYFLLTVLIQRDPFTGGHVDFNIENLIHGFMKLMEGGEEQFQQMKESGAIARASQKITAAVKTLNFTWEYIKGLFTSLWESLGWKDFLNIFGVFARIVKTFGKPVLRLIAFIIEIIRIVIEVLLIIMNFPFDLINNIIAKAMLAFEMIKKDPIGFLRNLLRAIKQGFTQFFGNILTHLWNGLKAWFLGEVKAAGIPIPTDFSVMGIIKWLLAVLDITMEKIWKKLEERIGKEKVAKIRNLIDKAEKIANAAGEAYEFIQDVQKRGFMAVMIDKIKEKLSNVWDMVLEAVKSFVMDQIIKKITVKLLSMLDPSGIMAVVNSAIALYKAIQSFIRYLRQMLEIVNSFVEGLVEIASGAITSAANFLEGALGRGVPIAIGFFANQVGLNLSERLKDALELVREKVDKGLTWVIDKLVTVVEKLVTMGKAGIAALKEWWKARKDLKTKDGESHTIYFEGEAGNARLLIATTPVPIRSYLTKVKDDNKLKDEDIAKPLGTVDKIENKEKENPATEDLKTKQTNDMSDLMAQLAGELAELPLELAGVNSNPIFGGTYQSAFGTSAILAFQQAPFAKGSEPNVNHPSYSKINIRKDGGGSYYVKGHLLNDNLGGPGTVWNNLTPLNRDANKDHQLSFEDKVKEAVNGTTARGINTASLPKLGYMKGFSVTVNYGRSDPPALTQLKDDTIDTPPPGADPGWSMTELQELLEGEKAVPNAINCSATVKKKGATAEEQVSYTVTNNINYGVLNQYQLGVKPKTPVTLASLINTSAKTDKEMSDSFKTIIGIGSARAKNIYAAFKQKGRITNGKSDIGIGLLALNNLNDKKNLNITSGNLLWPSSPATPVATN